MTRFTDGNKTVEISIQRWNGSGWGPDWSEDFFNVGSLDYDEDLEAYQVWSVEYLKEQLEDWKAGVGDFQDDYCGADEDDEYFFDYIG